MYARRGRLRAIMKNNHGALVYLLDFAVVVAVGVVAGMRRYNGNQAIRIAKHGVDDRKENH